MLVAAVKGADLSYTFHYEPTPSPKLVVDLSFDVNQSGPKQLVLPSQYGGQNEMWRSISALEVVSGPIQLQPGSRPELRTIQAADKGPCHIRYAVTGVTRPLKRSVYYWPVLTPAYIHLLGKAFLVKPDWPELQRLSVELNWRLPKGWMAGDSFGLSQGVQQFSTSLFELQQAVYVAGDFRFHRFEIRGKPGAVALRGQWGFTDDEFAVFVKRIVTAERALWEDDNFPFFFVTLLPVDLEPGSFSGVGRWDGFAIFLPMGAKLDASVRYLLAHELFHTWNATKLSHSAGVPPALYWFSEGFTDYYAYLLLMLEGFESFPDYVDRMNKIIARYWSWRTRNLPNEAAAKAYYTDNEAQKLAYLRGTLVALNWNAAIRDSSKGKLSLNDFMLALKRRSEDNSEELTSAVLVSEARKFGVTAAANQVTSWIDRGDTVEVRKDSFGSCAEMIGADPPRFRATREECAEWFKTAARDFRVSLSVSPFVERLFNNGVTFTDGKVTATNPQELQKLFASHGANEVYARIATEQRYKIGPSDHSMERALERARTAKSLGLPFNPELGIFKTYGDIRCQPAPDFSDYPDIKVPGVWTSLTLDQMLPILRAYGAVAARQILSTGVQVRIWDLGNEVEFGIAGVAVHPMPGGCDDTASAGWYKPPDAVDPVIGKMSAVELMKMPEARRIAWLETHLWPHEARILAAMADGIRSVDPRARFSTHVSGISSVLPAQAVAFYRAMKNGGFRADELGVSYYPTSSSAPKDRLQAFKDMATAVHRELDRPVFVAEFGYPAAKMQSGFVWNDAVDGYPLTPEGQANFIRDLVAWGVRSGLLSGIRPWAPDLAAPGWAPMSFFLRTGKTATGRPALDAIAPQRVPR